MTLEGKVISGKVLWKNVQEKGVRGHKETLGGF